MRNHITILLLFWLTYFIPKTGIAEQHTLIFNEKGQLLSAPPNLIKHDDTIKITVQVSQEYMNNRILKMYEQYKFALNRLIRKDSNGKNILERSGLIGVEAERIQNQVQYELATQLKSLLVNGISKEVIQTKYNIYDELKKLDSIIKENPGDPKQYTIPDLNKLILPQFSLTHQYYGLKNNNTLTKYDNNCKNNEILISGEWNCNWLFNAKNIIKYNGSEDTPVKLNFDLKQISAEFIELEKQVKITPIDQLFNNKQAFNDRKEILIAIEKKTNEIALKKDLINGLSNNQKELFTNWIKANAADDSNEPALKTELINTLSGDQNEIFNKWLKLKVKYDNEERIFKNALIYGLSDNQKVLFTNWIKANTANDSNEPALKTELINTLSGDQKKSFNQWFEVNKNRSIAVETLDNLVNWGELRDTNDKNEAPLKKLLVTTLSDKQKDLFKKWIEAKEINDRTEADLKKDLDKTLSDEQKESLKKWLKAVDTNDKKEVALKEKLEIDKSLPNVKRTILMNELTSIYNKSNKYLIQLIWLNKGNISADNDFLTANPLAFSNTETLESEIKNKSNELTELKKNLEEINKQIIYYENLYQNQEACCSNLELKKNIKVFQDNHKELLKNHRISEISIEAIQKEIDAKKKELAGIKSGDNIFKTSILKDSLLYRGELYVNSKAQFKGIYMRHHDAINDYHLMGISPVKEINEEEILVVLIHNSVLNKNLFLKTTVVPINPDNDVLTDNVLADEKKTLGTAPELEILASKLMNILSIFKNKILTLPIQKIEDNSPNYLTKKINHKLPEDAPTIVKYEIMDSISKANTNSELTSFNYRFNNLYRFRFKAGLLYSNLNRNDYTINTATNTASLISERAGLGGSFGLQIFPKRIDIRTTGVGFRPFIYTGFIFTKTITENFLLGGGFEIINGLAVLGGLHIGQTELLTTKAGLLDIRSNHFATNGFVSFAVSIPIFDRFFNLNNLTNPFKKL
jgi:hypothetical protein